MSEIPNSLIAAYTETHYRVFASDATLTLRIGAHSEPLAKLHTQFDVTSSALLTAYNPGSDPTTDPRANLAAQASLVAALEAAGLQWTAAEGADPTGKWPTEPSVLVLGISRDQAAALAQQFQQNAFVFSDALALPALVLLR